MQRLLNAMKQQAELAQRGSHARLGTVRGYDPNTYRAKVMIQPENQITGWMPVATEWVGNGWGMFAPPAEGDAVLVEFFHGDFESGIITRRFYHNDARPAPTVPPATQAATVPIGEFWLVHQSGSALQFHNDGSVVLSSVVNSKVSALNFHNDGSVELISTAALTATVGGDLNANVTGNFNATVKGNAVIKAASVALQNGGTLLKKLVNETFLSLYDSHTHPTSTAGSPTLAPTATFLSGPSNKTSITTAE